MVITKLPSMEYISYKHDINTTDYFDLVKFILIAKQKEVLDGLLATSGINPSNYANIIHSANKVILDELKLLTRDEVTSNG